MRSDRGSQIQAHLSTDVDRIMVAKPPIECNIVLAMFLEGTPMSSTLLLTVSTRPLVRMCGGLCSACRKMAQTGWCAPMQQHKQHTEQPVGDVHAILLSYVSAGVRDCARPSASPSQATDVELVRVAMPHTQRNSVSEIGLHGEPLSSARCFFCFLLIDVSWM